MEPVEYVTILIIYLLINAILAVEIAKQGMGIWLIIRDLPGCLLVPLLWLMVSTAIIFLYYAIPFVNSVMAWLCPDGCPVKGLL